MATTAMIQLQQVSKNYTTEAGVFHALHPLDLQVNAGEFVAVVGKSGSGKSTLLNLITGIDRPTDGTVMVAGTAVHTLSEGQTAVWRGKTIGVVFQFFQLLPTLTVLENVILPMDFCNYLSFAQRKPRALALLDRVGLSCHAQKLPEALSGGEQQRVAIARALANDPPLIMADEPTGNLDSQTGADVFAMFGELVQEGKTVLMVTHERSEINVVTRTVRLADGKIIADHNGRKN